MFLTSTPGEFSKHEPQSHFENGGPGCNEYFIFILGQTGAWDPLLQCLHLDKSLLQQQNTKKL